MITGTFKIKLRLQVIMKIGYYFRHVITKQTVISYNRLQFLIMINLFLISLPVVTFIHMILIFV